MCQMKDVNRQCVSGVDRAGAVRLRGARKQSETFRPAGAGKKGGEGGEEGGEEGGGVLALRWCACEDAARSEGESCSVFRQCPNHTSIFLPRLSPRASKNNPGSLVI